jgi:hypothetical protein
MIWGMTTATFTALHVVISLIGIVTGLIVLYGLLNAKRLDGWTAIFLVTTVLTSVTGFVFPFSQSRHHLSHIACDCDSCPLCPSPGRRLALDLRGLRYYGSISKCLCPGGTELREGTGFESDGPDPVRAAIRGRAGNRSGGIRCAGIFRG